MRQQVNLYQLSTASAGVKLSATTLCAGLSVVIVALVAISTFGARQSAKLEQQLAVLSQQQQKQQQLVEALAANVGAKAPAQTTNIATQLTLVQQQLSDRKQALALLRAGVAGQPEGFANRLEALARRHVDGVWLDHVSLAATGIANLRGDALDADLVPRYLQELAAERALQGSRFDEFVIEMPHAPKNSEAEEHAATPDVKTHIRFNVTNSATKPPVKDEPS